MQPPFLQTLQLARNIIHVNESGIAVVNDQARCEEEIEWQAQEREKALHQ